MTRLTRRSTLGAACLAGATLSVAHCSSQNEVGPDAGGDSAAASDAKVDAAKGLEASAPPEAGLDSAGDSENPEDSGGPMAPSPAAAVGYLKNTFSSTLSAQSIDLADSRTSGFQWYLARFFAPATHPATDANDFTFDGGAITMGVTEAGGLQTAAPAKNSAGWVGVAFGGGGYFEATFKFDPALVREYWEGGTNSWPAWWSTALESAILSPGFYWPSQLPNPLPEGGCAPTKCYTHSIEPDFFEYDTWNFSPDAGSYFSYGGAVHDHYGIYQATCDAGYCEYTNKDSWTHLDAGFDFDTYHTYGFLWVPATASEKGYARYYVDGSPTTDHIAWTQYTGNESPPPNADAGWTFGVLDQDHLVLFLSTGEKQLMTVQSVQVWQASAGQNLTE